MRINVSFTLFKRRPLTAIVGLLRRTRGVTSTTLQHLPMSKSREAGFSSILIVLMTAVVLIGVITTTTTVTLGQRKNSSNELAAYTAVLASESGQETFKARAASRPFATATPTCSGLLAQGCYQSAYTGALNSYLASLGTITTPNGQATLSVASVIVDAYGSLTGVDVLSTSLSGNDKARIIRSYITQRLNVAFPRVPGALTSYPGVDLSGNVTIGGRTVTDPANTGVITNFITVQNSSTGFLTAGSPVSVTVSPQGLNRLAQLQIGQYVRLPTTLPTGLPGADATFRVSGKIGDQLNLIAVQVPLVPSTLASGPLALTNVLNGVASSLGTQLTVNAVEAFYPGDKVSVTVAGITYTTTVTALNGNALTTLGWPTGTPTVLPEGTVLVKSTNAVVTAGGYAGSKGQTAADGAIVSGVSGGQLITAPTNNALFQQLLGTTPVALQSVSTVFTSTTFTGAVSGLTWLDTGPTQSINLNSEKVNGKGLLVVDGDLNLNNNGNGNCDFSGVLVVRGNLRLQGNIEICGALIVEGSILTQDGLNVTGIDSSITSINGTGQKVRYDPAAILDALNNAGPYAFTGARNWRQR